MAAHADEKYKKGPRGPPTPIEQVNMYVDKLADSVYTDYTIGGLQTKKIPNIWTANHHLQKTRSHRTLAEPDQRTNQNGTHKTSGE